MAYKQPDKNGFYGRFGGRFVPETLMTAVLELEEAYRESQADPFFSSRIGSPFETICRSGNTALLR